MNDLTTVLLEADAEPTLPLEIVGWGILLVSIAITIVWLVYLYR